MISKFVDFINTVKELTHCKGYSPVMHIRKKQRKIKCLENWLVFKATYTCEEMSYAVTAAKKSSNLRYGIVTEVRSYKEPSVK